MITREIKGVRKTIENLRKKQKDIGKAVERGLIRVGLDIQRRAMRITPIDTGNLRRSFFTRRTDGHGYHARVVVGNTASYAIFVHEITTNYHKPPTRSKFLTAAIAEAVKEKAPSRILKEEVRRSTRKSR